MAASIAIPTTPAPKLGALTPTTDVNTAYNELGGEFQNELNATGQESAQLGTNLSTALGQLKQTQTNDLNSLNQAKANAFKTDSLNANTRGLLFSGYTPYTNNQYVTNTYNPNVAKVNEAYTQGSQNAQTTYTTNQQSLQDKIAEINQQRADEAQQLVLNTQSANAAAAKSAATAAAKQPTQQQVVQAIFQGLSSVKGNNGYVAPQDYASAYQDWVSAGYSPSSFATYFKNFQDPNNGYYDYAISQLQKKK